MKMTRKTITIPSAMESWVKAQIAMGRYANDSEYFRDLIRHDQERHAVETKLRSILDEAEASGLSEKSIDQIWTEAEARHLAKNG
ncbi:MAG: type II toxin-antitoxin system ParD family antitoxin [Alphaproteobacteria bacterium]|nr:type II toxin-antitoxin system ParD family antitoxin [Alphaproteobacteria bacterium]